MGPLLGWRWILRATESRTASGSSSHRQRLTPHKLLARGQPFPLVKVTGFDAGELVLLNSQVPGLTPSPGSISLQAEGVFPALSCGFHMKKLLRRVSQQHHSFQSETDSVSPSVDTLMTFSPSRIV
jgi:hypothetical protein